MLKKPKVKLRRYAWLAIPILVLAAATTTAMIILKPAPTTAIVTECTGELAEQFTCWQSRYNAIVANQSPETAMDDFKKQFDAVPYVKSNCHQISHVIGRAAAKRYDTLQETYEHGDNFCWSGYYHGSIETIARQIGKDKILSQLTGVCADFKDKRANSFEHFNCVHGMGHGLMALQDGELFTALESCDTYQDPWEAESCYGGVFMENVMNEINMGGHSKYLRHDDPLYPCTAVKDRYKQACYLMQTSHALTVVKQDYPKVFGLCAGVGAAYEAVCYQSLGRDASGQSSSDQTRTIELCMLGPSQPARQNCFTGAVKDFISYHNNDSQGLAMCAAIPDATLAAGCTSEAHNYYRIF
jgi:hypothetical protein